MSSQTQSTRQGSRSRRRITALSIAAVASLFPAIPAASAATKTWVGADGLFWNNPASWSPAGVPVNGDDAVLGTQAAGTTNVQANFTSTYTGAGLNSLKINSTGIGGTFTLSQSLGGSAMIATTEIIGDTISANVYTQNGGTNTASTVTLGNGAGGGGAYTLSGTGTLNVATFVVGNAGFGTVNLSGGTINLTNFMGISQTNVSSTSNFNMTAGNLTVASGAYFAVGASRGNFNQSGGIVSFLGPNGFYVANGTTVGVNNTYTLSGTGQITNANFESLGQSLAGGTATFTQTGGSNSFISGGVLSVGDQGNGAYNLSAGSLSAPTETVGNANSITGTFTQTGGSNTLGSSGILNLGSMAGSTGLYTMDNSAGTSSLNAPTENIGVSGTGTFTQNAGTNSSLQLTLGTNSGAAGTYNLNGGNLTVGTVSAPGVIDLGLSATGALFSQTAGNTSVVGVGGAFYIGYNSGSSGTYLLKGGTLSTDALYVGVFGNGTMTQSGGNNTITNNSLSSGLYVGYAGQGTYTLNSNNSNASLSATNESIGIAASGIFNQRGTTTNTVAGLLSVGAGSGGTGSYNISSGNLIANSATIGSNGGIGSINQSGSSNVTIQTGGLIITSFAGTGTYNLNGGTLNTPAGTGYFVVNPGGTFSQSGGTYNGYLLNSGTVAYSGGTFNGTLENAINGSVTLNASLVAGGGVLNKGFITIPLAGGLGSGISGLASLDNENTITLTGGSLTGSGLILNNGGISGYGTITGSGGFTNNGAFTQGAGTLFFSNTGANNNYGSISLAAGHQLQIVAGTLINNASFTINGSLISGAGTLNNAAGGTLLGPGTITAAIQNTGTIEPGNSTLTISNAWTNANLVLLTGPASSLVGGTITNNATIQGVGSVGSPITNNGVIEALGGTLALNSTVTNPVGGTLTASSTNKLFISTGLATNVGLINLTGGTFDNGNHPLNNTGQISGFGIFRTGGLTNNANITFSGTNGSTTTINGDLTNSAGKNINIKYNPAIFTGNITNNAGAFIKTTSTTATFTGSFTNNGTYTSDPSTNIFQSDVNSAGTMTGGVGDVYIFSSGNVTNSGTFNNGGTLQSSDNTTNSGTFTQSGPQLWTVGTTFSNTAGTATFASDTGSVFTSPLNVAITGGTVNLAATQHLNSLTVTTGTGAITAGTTKTNALTLGGSSNNWTGNLSLGNNKLVVEATALNKTATLTTLQNEAFYGMTHATGITSTALPANLALAVIDNGGLITPFTIFGGVSVDTNSILVAPELLGDANIDGRVDLNDLNTVLNNLGTPSGGWIRGGFDGQATIDLNDLNDVLNNLGTTYANSNAVVFAEALVGSQAAPTPEPCALSILSLASVAMLLRRRR